MAEKPEELSLPVAPVSRVINDALPANVHVSQETRKTIAKAASVFVLYTTATAAAMSQKAGRKTMNSNDVMEAISDMEFPQFRDTLESLLIEYRTSQKKKKDSSSAKKSSISTGDKKKDKDGSANKDKNSSTNVVEVNISDSD